MRIPLPIAILSCVIVLSIVWFVGTRDKDFISPPTPEDMVKISEKWQESRPNIPPPKPINAALLADAALGTPLTPSIPEQVKVENLPVGNLLHSPALSEYGAYGDKGTDAMIRLATLLETKGELQRALLAWERVIDTSNPGDEERALAVTAIKRLKPALPPWNPDPAAEISITLRSGATLREKDILIDAMKQAAEAINEASGFILKVETEASIGKARGKRTPRIPVAIWFSRKIEGKDTAAETPPISFMADPQQKEMMVAQIEAGIYALIRAHLASSTNFSPLPEYPSGAKPDELIHLHVTRLMWREFVTSMKE
ncbi:MAG: hypothetical protein AB8F34_03020 [Akkermansiaceae bacterium]